jgi:predicted kinase
VIIDATHARRPWRLALTQALLLPAPLEWIGWWLYTPLPSCLIWNRQRERQVPEAVIQEMAAAGHALPQPPAAGVIGAA